MVSGVSSGAVALWSAASGRDGAVRHVADSSVAASAQARSGAAGRAALAVEQADGGRERAEQCDGAGALEAGLLGGGGGLGGEAQRVALGGVERDQVDRQHCLDGVARVERAELV